MSAHSDVLQDLAAQLRAAMQGRHSFETSQVRIIGLKDIKKEAGAEWGHFAARVRTCSKDFIDRRLERGDILIPAGDGFVVIYASPEDVETKSAALQLALNTFYLGEDGMEAVRAEVHAQAIAADQILSVFPTETPGGPDKGRAESAADADLTVLPVWSVTQQAVTGYWISPVKRIGGVSHYGYDRAWRESGAHGEEDFLAIDLAILNRAITSVQHCLDTRRPCLVAYSVHVTTMQHRDRRQAFLQQLHATPERLRPYLLGRIAEITPGTPKATLADWVLQLRPVSQHVTIELHHTERLVGGLGDIGIFSVVWVAPPMLAEGPKLKSYARLIQTWRPILKRDGLRFRVDNLTNPDLLAQAVEHGIDFCSSERLWPSVAEPEGIRPYSLAQFQAGLRSSPARRALSA